MAANYGELTEEVRSYLYNRKDLTARIPQFIAFGENTIFRRLRILKGGINSARIRSLITIMSSSIRKSSFSELFPVLKYAIHMDVSTNTDINAL